MIWSSDTTKFLSWVIIFAITLFTIFASFLASSTLLITCIFFSIYHSTRSFYRIPSKNVNERLRKMMFFTRVILILVALDMRNYLTSYFLKLFIRKDDFLPSSLILLFSFNFLFDEIVRARSHLLFQLKLIHM